MNVNRMCPRCSVLPVGTSKGGTPWDYCEICQRHRTSERQQAFKEACLDYRGRTCHFCGEEITCPAAACFRAPKGQPRGTRLSSLTGAVPLRGHVEDVLDTKVVCCANCERVHYRSKSGQPSRKKARVVEYLGGKCARCSETRAVTLDAHHTAGRGHESKRFNPGERGRTWEETKNELDGCELLCANCHAAHHFEEAEEKREEERNYLTSLREVV